MWQQNNLSENQQHVLSHNFPRPMRRCTALWRCGEKDLDLCALLIGLCVEDIYVCICMFVSMCVFFYIRIHLHIFPHKYLFFFCNKTNTKAYVHIKENVVYISKWIKNLEQTKNEIYYIELYASWP